MKKFMWSFFAASLLTLTGVASAQVGPCLANTNQQPKFVYQVSFNASTKTLEGWVFDERNPCKQVVGAVWMEGAKLGDLRAYQASGEFSNAVDSAINNAFSMVVPDSKIKGQPRLLRFKRNGILLFEVTVTI